MTKNEILEYFKDINHAYNDCTRYDTLKRMLDELQEPCTDAISRQAVLDAIEKAQYSCDFCKEHHIDYSISMEMVRIILHDLPPVAPKQSFESMTNGEVIQALFPKIKVKQLVGVKGLLHVFFDKKEDNAFDENWWNAPYKGGAE